MYRGFITSQKDSPENFYQTQEASCPRCGEALDMHMSAIRRVTYCRKCGFNYEQRVEGERFGDGI